MNSAESISAFKEETNDHESYLCSCCLSSSNLTNMLQVFSNEDVKLETYLDVMKDCYSSKILDESGTLENHYICEVCTERLLESYKFKCQVVESQKNLLNFIKDRTCKIKHATRNESQSFAEFFSSNDSTGEFGLDESVDTDHIYKEEYYDSDAETITKEGSHRKRKLSKRLTISLKGTAVNNKRKKSMLMANPSIESKVTEKQYLKDRDAQIYASLDFKNMQCRECLKTFRNSHNLAQHANEHFKNYTCEICGKGFALRRRYIHHLKRHVTGSYQCRHCDKVFDKKDKLQNHIGNHHKPKHVCKLCKQRFRSYYTRQKHMRDAHGDVVTYPCDQCSVVCITATALNAHVRQRHKARERTHSCVLCSKEFYTSNSLKRHLVVHTGERIYECSDCGKAYARTSTLMQHMKIHKNVREHVCVHCGQEFVQKCSLKWHLKKHEKKELADSDDSRELVIGE